MRIFTSRTSRGFTTVELLITLFVAATFLAAGYQLFSLIITDSGNTRAEAAASNAAYDYLRRYSDSANNPCVSLTPVADQTVTIEGVSNPTVTVSITCPQSQAATISKVEVTVNYGSGSEAKSVKYATYVDKSKALSSNTDVTSGLIGWWKLNGNGESSAGPYTGVTYLTTPVTSQNGQPNGALSFNGTSSYFKISGDTITKPTNAFSATVWLKANSIKTNASVFSATETGGWSIRAPQSTCSGAIGVYLMVGGSYTIPCASTTLTTGNWIFVAFTYDSSLASGNAKLYINNAAPVSVTTSGAMTWPANPSVPICIGSEPTTSADCLGGSNEYFDGTIDDARFYDRAITASEVSKLYLGGAK